MVKRFSEVVCTGLLVLMSSAFSRDASGARGIDQDDRPIVVLETSLGDIVLELRPDRAPKTVANFLGLVRAGFYDEMLFHRVVNRAVIQAGVAGGGPLSTWIGTTTAMPLRRGCRPEPRPRTRSGRAD